MRVQKEKRATPKIKYTNSEANPIINKDTHKAMYEINNGFRLLNFDTSHPDIGSPINELIGITSKRLPNSASSKLKLLFILGILDAHEANKKPKSIK